MIHNVSLNGKNTLMSISRRGAREHALKTLYSWLINKEISIDRMIFFYRNEFGPTRIDVNYLKLIVTGTIKDAAQIEEAIKPHLNRELASVSPVERAILLLGTFEMIKQSEIPYRVIINEAVELAKDYGGTDGYKFVNGVLDKLVVTLRPKELNAR